MQWHWDVIPRNFKYFMLGQYPDGPMGGLLLTMVMSVLVILMCFVLGIVFGLMRYSKNKYWRFPAIGYIEFIRGTPVLMVIFWCYFMLPKLIPVLQGRTRFEWTSALVALVAFYGAQMAEVVRAGLESIGRGQTEAALSSGLTYVQVIRYIIMPQGLKNMIPAIVGTFISVIKDTSLVYIIGVAEFTRTVFQVNNRVLNAPMELFLFAAVVYFVPCYMLSKLSIRLEKRLAAGVKVEI